MDGKKNIDSYNIFILRDRIMNIQQGKCKELYQKYRIQSEIGRGASGVCYRVLNIRTKQQNALKKIHINSMKKHNTKEACSQVSILSKLDHPNIIKLLQFFTDENYLYIIMQYAPKGDLYNILKKRKIRRDFYSESEIWQMSRQLLSALDYLHSHHIIHRDVKTLNIFMDNQGKLYLGDLGVSKILKTDNGLYSRVGTPLYLSPQIIKYQKYDYKADIWGLGCVCYQLAMLCHPFEGKNIISLGQNIIGSQPKQVQNYSVQLNNFILDMLQKNPNKRLGANELLKKYFKQGTRPQITSQTIMPQIKEKQVQIQTGRNLNALKSNLIRRKVVNNFLEEKLLFDQSDKIKQETHKDQKNVIFKYSPTKKQLQKKLNDKIQEQTLIFTKKMKRNEQNKRFVEATYKSCLVPHPLPTKQQQSKHELITNNQPEPIGTNQKGTKNNIKTEDQCNFFLFSEKESQNKKKEQKQISLANYVSDKKITSVFINKSSTRSHYPPCIDSRESAQQSNNRIDTSYTDVNRLPSQSHLSGMNKIAARVRPKSSIMTKQRHETTMKNIKKSLKRTEIDNMDRFVETQVLKRPEMIIL